MSKKSYSIHLAEEQGAQIEKQKQEQAEKRRQELKKQQDEINSKIADNNIVFVDEAKEKEIEKENEDLEMLITHRVLIDLHGMNLQEALSWAGSWAHRVINSEDMMCIGLVHGQGIHTDGYLDNLVVMRELSPVLKPRIRALMDKYAYKTGCYSIYGEKLFMGDPSDDDIFDHYRHLSKEELQKKLQHIEQKIARNETDFMDVIKYNRIKVILQEKDGFFDNPGITYFMNNAYYNYFKNAHIKWTKEKMHLFQKT